MSEHIQQPEKVDEQNKPIVIGGVALGNVNFISQFDGDNENAIGLHYETDEDGKRYLKGVLRGTGKDQEGNTHQIFEHEDGSLYIKPADSKK